MRTYARIQDGIVAELIATDADIADMFHPDLRWVDATDAAGVSPGWRYDGAHFSAPEAPHAPA
jgi:hypothetical protein